MSLPLLEDARLAAACGPDLVFRMPNMPSAPLPDVVASVSRNPPPLSPETTFRALSVSAVEVVAGFDRYGDGYCDVYEEAAAAYPPG